jgi:hypothetical protein
MGRNFWLFLLARPLDLQPSAFQNWFRTIRVCTLSVNRPWLAGPVRDPTIRVTNATA